MAASSQSGTTTSSQLNYLPGQEEYVKDFVSPLQKVYGGNMSASPLYGIAKNASDKEMSKMAQQIAGQGGLSSPARAKLLSQLAGKGAEATQGALSSTWQSALELLSKYSLAAPTVTTTTSGGGGSSFGL